MSERNNTSGGINNRLDIAEEISGLEGLAIETIQNETQREKKD